VTYASAVTGRFCCDMIQALQSQFGYNIRSQAPINSNKQRARREYVCHKARGVT